MRISVAEKSAPRVRGTTVELQAKARWLRDNMTGAEAHLWGALRDRRLGALRFRAQHPVGRFILDFYCSSCKLAIEVDGPVHDYQHGRDEGRTAILHLYGYDLIRFSNEEVMTQLPDVLARTLAAARFAHLRADKAETDKSSSDLSETFSDQSPAPE